MLNEKREKYIELIKDMKECRLCQGIKAPAYCEEGEHLLNDSHGIVSGQEPDMDKIYVNRWNMWQGSLDAEIMVIGLDFGKITVGSIDQPERHRWWEDRISDWESPTDKNLNQIFSEVFGEGFDLTKPCSKLFFTNVACCYRQKKTSGDASEAWYVFCARRYLGRLIRIIEPRLIICLGSKVFEALGYCEDGRIICTDDRKPEGKMPLRELLNASEPYHFELKIGDKRIKVAPVYHPGANMARNRKDKKIVYEDWGRIHKVYEQLKD